MTKTTALTSTRSLDEIAAEFAEISDKGTLRLSQARLTYEWVGSTEGKDAADLRNSFRLSTNAALLSKKEDPLSETAIVYFVNTWKYMLRANVDTNPETNEKAGDAAKAAYVLASQTFRKKEENYVTPAINAILTGMDAAEAFAKATSDLTKDKTADAERKAAEKAVKENEADKEITFDVLVATIALLTPENVKTFTDAQKSKVRELLATATANLA